MAVIAILLRHRQAEEIAKTQRPCLTVERAWHKGKPMPLKTIEPVSAPSVAFVGRFGVNPLKASLNSATSQRQTFSSRPKISQVSMHVQQLDGHAIRTSQTLKPSF
jgi:hypothetical protein